ncbi:FHA domain-containing protein [Pirellulales bacterium]|nr:FHA domain-containing protein [Pirellulales bacterium]
MEVSLKVLAGAKVGAKVAVKKKQFVIGRAAECHLHVGTTSISRKHCVIERNGQTVTVKDLGSRNGTIVNGKKIVGETELSAGDEIELGPLTLQVRISPGLDNEKKPKISSVAEAVGRTAGQLENVDDDDISSWLLGPSTPSISMKETQAVQFDETNILHSPDATPASAASSADDASASDVLSEDDEGSGKSDVPVPEPTKTKAGPGKLPSRPEKPQTKDSVEAAEMALRNWSRRR